MPFTISHAAAVLPFARQLNRQRALSAAVIGSMTPDFNFLLPWQVTRIESHSLGGLIAFCLPWGLLSYWLFEYIVKPTTREVLPDTAYLRSAAHAAPDPIDSMRQWAVAVSAVLFGGLTHLAWDGFTHEGARGVRMIPMLDDSVDIGGHSLFAFQVAQHLSSIIGLAIVLQVLWSAMRAQQAPPAPPQRELDRQARRWWMGAYVGVALACCALSYGIAHLRNHLHGSLAFILDNAAIGGLRGLVFSLLGVSLLLRARLRAGKKYRPAARS